MPPRPEWVFYRLLIEISTAVSGSSWRASRSRTGVDPSRPVTHLASSITTCLASTLSPQTSTSSSAQVVLIAPQGHGRDVVERTDHRSIGGDPLHGLGRGTFATVDDPTRRARSLSKARGFTHETTTLPAAAASPRARRGRRRHRQQRPHRRPRRRRRSRRRSPGRRELPRQPFGDLVLPQEEPSRRLAGPAPRCGRAGRSGSPGLALRAGATDHGDLHTSRQRSLLGRRTVKSQSLAILTVILSQ